METVTTVTGVNSYAVEIKKEKKWVQQYTVEM